MQSGPPQEHIKLLVCPNDSGAVGAPNAISYVVNCGMRDAHWNHTKVGDKDGVYERHSYFEPPANGVFHNNWQYGGEKNGRITSTWNRSLNSLAYISAGDGTSSTLMVSENVDAGYWHGSYNQTTVRVYENSICFCWVPTTVTDSSNQMRINVKIGQDPYQRRSPRPSGNHDSGVNVIFCDAHSAFISENIDWMTWCLLFTPSGRQVMQPANSGKMKDNQVLAPFRYTPLNEKF